MTHEELVSEVQQEVNNEETLVDQLEADGLLLHEEAVEAKREIEEDAERILAEDSAELGENSGPVPYEEANDEDFFD